ncbi:MAG: glutathione S-transferase family protein [Sneathiellales bacterium]|nr:glutathione S-transferase family protein [Sneathiellales bacterium]
MKFYDCSTAPSSRFVRMFIAEKGLDVETIEVDLRNHEHLSEEFRSINPYCTVPVLETEEGTRYTSTQGCWRYLEEKFPEPPLMGRDIEEKARIADLIWRTDIDGFFAVAEGLRNKARGMKDRAITGPNNYAQIPELSDRGMARTAVFMQSLEGILGENDFMAGNSFSAADIMVFVTIGFASWIKIPIPEDAEKTNAWYKRISERKSASL